MSFLRIDPSTPWRETAAALLDRTVGRERQVAWLRTLCLDYLAGGSPPYALVVGPRGAGKSHMLHVARGAVPEGSAVWLGEDAPTTRDPDELWARMTGVDNPWAWGGQTGLDARRILFVDGIDRRLGELDEAGRWAIRHRLQESAHHLVATGRTTDFASGPDAAFFGQFSTRFLEALPDDAALELLRRAREPQNELEQLGSLERADVRDELIVRLVGGSPRALTTCAQAIERWPTLGASAVLTEAVSRLVGNLQLRFLELPPLGQRIVERLALAPRALRASELSEGLATSSAAISTTARVLESASVLARVTSPSDGRVSYYQLADPMLRFWLEYRGGDGRTARAVQLLQHVAERDTATGEQPSSAASDAKVVALLQQAHAVDIETPTDRGGPAAMEALRFARHLAEHTRGPLHPELEALRVGWKAIVPSSEQGD